TTCAPATTSSTPTSTLASATSSRRWRMRSGSKQPTPNGKRGSQMAKMSAAERAEFDALFAAAPRWFRQAFLYWGRMVLGQQVAPDTRLEAEIRRVENGMRKAIKKRRAFEVPHQHHVQ